MTNVQAQTEAVARQLAELDKMIVARVNGKDVDRATLNRAFDRVADLNDWKAPIDSTLDLDVTETDLICEAIRFFAATEPTVQILSDGQTRIKADGYRAGPAGDH